ncbi:MAG TPA: hypothetical protein VH518_14830 [Tepidisphaeraceae bacterium]|jgi:ABC-type spermidine/putrescine transport system permease subunit I
MRQKLRKALICVVGILLVLLPTSVVRAQDASDKIYDARLEGYTEGAQNSNSLTVTLESSSTALMWLLLVVMAGICVGVMFKNAKRTHLD